MRQCGSSDGNDKRSKQARELLKYLENNKQGLLPYDRPGTAIPELAEGLIYEHMGVQENQNCTVITMRMKHWRMRWSVSGANNLAKALYQRENKGLINTIERYTDGLIFTMQMRQVTEILSAAKERRKGKRSCGYDKPAHAPVGCDADGIRQGHSNGRLSGKDRTRP